MTALKAMLRRQEAESSPLAWWAKGLLQEGSGLPGLFGSQPRHRFLIFAQGRTGSTLVVQLLHSHPDIHCDNELLRRPRVAPLTYVDNRGRRASGPVFGFHVKPRHLVELQRTPDLRRFLHDRIAEGWTIIHLWRENALEQVVSNMCAHQTGRFHHLSSDKRASQRGRFVLDPAEVLSRLGVVLDYQAAETRALAGLDHFELRYDRDLRHEERRNRAMRDLQKFLGVPPRDLTSALRKSNSRALSEMIENFADVAAAVERGGYGRFLEAA